MGVGVGGEQGRRGRGARWGWGGEGSKVGGGGEQGGGGRGRGTRWGWEGSKVGAGGEVYNLLIIWLHPLV